MTNLQAKYSALFWRRELLALILFVGGIASILGLIIGGVMLAQRTSCHSQADAMGMNWSWGPMQDCMIVVDGKNVPLSAYKVVKVAP